MTLQNPPQTTDASLVWRDASIETAVRADALLSQMSLAEKLAQLGSYWDDRRDTDQIIAPMQDQFQSGRPTFEQATAQGIGHLTRVFGTQPVTAAEGAAKLAHAQESVASRSRFGIPAIAHEECLTGFTTLGATVYPTALAWGATFDPSLIEEMAGAIGSDMRAVGVHQGLSPVLDVSYDYRWGRVEETISEDPYLVGMIGSAYVRGLETAGIIATLKHFAGYSASQGGRNHAPVSVGPRELADRILPPFEMAVREGGTRSVMNSYSEIDGVPAGADRRLLTTLLRDEWGFTGTVVSDYWSVAFLKAKHRIAATSAQAGALALHAGLDVELPDTGAYGVLAPLVESGELPIDIVDLAVRRVLTQKIDLGLLDADWSPAPSNPDVDLDSDRNRGVARRVAEESIVLLHNPTGILPLADPAGTISVIGPCADDVGAFLGCYAYPIHVLPRHPEFGMGLDIQSLPEALAESFSASTIVTAAGVPLKDVDRSGISAAVDVARSSEICIAVVGDRAGMFGKGTSGEGCDAASLELPGAQGELLDALLDSGTPVIVLVVSGRPYALGRYVDRAAAVVQAFMPGAEAAGALARIIDGTVNPSGRLPVQIPETSGGLPHSYIAPPLGHDGDRISSVSNAAIFPFGYGLSYTDFELGDLTLSSVEVPVDGAVEVEVTVRNTGSRSGSDVVQLYFDDPVAQVTRPTLQLLGFQRVELAAGEASVVRFSVDADRFSFTGLDLQRIVEPGRIDLFVGRSSRDLTLSAAIELTGSTRVVAAGRTLTTPTTVTHVG